jgi:hypothetical protein
MGQRKLILKEEIEDNMTNRSMVDFPPSLTMIY